MTLEKFLTEFFDKLKNINVKYCILRNYEELPYRNTGNDIDILIQNNDKEVVIACIHDIAGTSITSIVLRTYVTSMYISGVIWGDDRHAIEIDFVTALSWKGISYLSVEKVLNASGPIPNSPTIINSPDLTHEALVSFFSSYLIGGWINDKYQDFVQSVFSSCSGEIRHLLRSVVGKRLSDSLTDAVISNDKERLLAMLPRLRKGLFFRSLVRAPLRSGLAVIKHYLRELYIRFTSAFVETVCILGPDGAGKSIISTKVQKKLINTAKVIRVRHLKPELFRRGQDRGPVIHPHAQAPRSIFGSVLKLLAWLAECWIDRFAHGYRDGALEIWDRYYHDLLVDPVRYRYGGPTWIARWVGKLIPKCGLWILLDAAPEIIQARKQEVPLHETTRQRQAYLDLMQGFDNAVVVDASQPLENVVADVSSAIVNYMAQPTHMRLGL